MKDGGWSATVGVKLHCLNNDVNENFTEPSAASIAYPASYSNKESIRTS
jgi:hypothetical protein